MGDVSVALLQGQKPKRQEAGKLKPMLWLSISFNNKTSNFSAAATWRAKLVGGLPPKHFLADKQYILTYKSVLIDFGIIIDILVQRIFYPFWYEWNHRNSLPFADTLAFKFNYVSESCR